VQDPDALLVAHDVMGDTLFWLGEFAAARSHLEQGAALYDVRHEPESAVEGQGKQDEARQMLAAIYAWFTEGHDTPDRREAQALLEELS
jgi:hypothetical protein